MACTSLRVFPLVSPMGLPVSNVRCQNLFEKKICSEYSLIWIISPYVERIQRARYQGGTFFCGCPTKEYDSKNSASEVAIEAT